ncbi:hypothetical protein ACJ72_03521 [Emergomyces africanus]|uniref:Uncharacterized protein n=1 Tax=Emergomyces africanus TaxID=1955775 RepID=A0A1B7NZD5_9EURO|nr:hypothetical protein ACJ72_03521 [Emergomyces africanus]
MGGTTVTYNHTQPLVAERPIVTLVDDETDSGGYSRTSPSSRTSRTSRTSTQSDHPHPAKRQRTNSYNLRQSKTWQGFGSPDIPTTSKIQTHKHPSLGHPFSPLGHVSALDKERDIHSVIESKSDLFSFAKHLRDNNPIAVAIWLAQNIHNIKKKQSSHPRNPSLEEDALINNTSQRPKRRRSQIMKDANVYPASEVRLSGSRKFPEFNREHNCESQTATTTMDIEQSHGEQNPSLDSYSTKPFHCQTDLKARRIATKLAKLQQFKPGFGDSLFDTMLDNHRIDADTATAGKLLVNALLAPICPEPQSICQAATDALIEALDLESPLSSRFTKAFAILSNDPDVQRVVDVIVAQINSCEFGMGLDGEYDVHCGLSSYHSPNASHSPQCVNEKQTPIVARALDKHLDSPQRSPSACSSISSSSCSSRHFLHENNFSNTSSVSTESQNRSVTENLLSSATLPRHSSTKGQVPKAPKIAEEKTIANTCKESNDSKSDMDATNRGGSNPSNAADLALASPNRRMTARSIDEIATLARVNGRTRTAATRQPKRQFASPSVDQIAAAASLGKFMSTKAPRSKLPKQQCKAPRKTKSKTSASVLSSSASILSPDTNAMVEQLLGLATAASEFGFKPEIEIDLHRARRDWYAEQLAAALNKAATEKSLENNTAQKSQVTAAVENPLPSQPITSVAKVHSLETGVTIPTTTPTEDFALTLPSCTDSIAFTKNADASAGVAAALTLPSTQPNGATERTKADQPATLGNPVPDESMEPDVFRWFISTPDQKILDSSTLSHSYLPRPWTDSDGWIHTGLGNEHNEEKVIVSDTYIWIRPRDSFNNPRITPSPPQVKSLIQIELDDAFGYPPPGRKPNLPLELEGPFIIEDVAVETEKAKVFHAAQIRGIIIDRSTPLDDIRHAIRKYDEIYAGDEAASGTSDGNENGKGKARAKPSDTSADTSRRRRASRKRTAGQSRGISVPKREDDEPTVKLSETARNKKRRLNIDTESSSVSLDDGSGSLADAESMAVDSKPILLTPRGPGRPSRRAALTAAAAAISGTWQARAKRSKRAPRKAPPESITPPASGMVADGVANTPIALETKEATFEKDDISITAPPEQESRGL